jgi:alkanesulfonate monooxygenase SsuD/methylene tetrahydromethanopterin reductase-like flavin-dependent oxidoreductase (luciferase family)
MKAGMFLMPSHPPERSFYDGQQWDLQVLRWADELGYDEAWIGEHYTSPWEPNPSPDLLITQALLQTSRITLAPGGFLLPYHHPAELAHRVAFLDHLAQGRLMFGVAASGLPSDWRLFDVDGMSGENREMTRESLEIILRLWQEPGPWEYQGKFWSVNKPDTMYDTLKYHITPFQKPHPPIGIAGLSPGSETLKTAGEKGFYPMSLNISPGYVASHWQAVEEGAQRTGRTPHRSDWRLVREIFVAETDAEARRYAVEGMLGRVMREYLLPLFGKFGFTQFFKHDQSVPDADVGPEYLVDHGWLVGSVETVVEKLEQMYEEVGGFGSLLHYIVDYADNPGPWKQSMELLMKEVLPRVQHLSPEPVAAGLAD